MENVRQTLAAMIEAGRDYQISPGRVTYPIAFSVKIYHDQNEAMGAAIRSFIDAPGSVFGTLNDQEIGSKVYQSCDLSSAAEMALKDMRESVSDNDGYYFIRPEIGAPLGIADDDRIECVFSFAGRSGGWLLIEEFQGLGMTGLTRHDLAREIQSDEERYSETWCIRLLAYLRECELQFSYDAITHEKAWKTGFHLLENCDGALDVLEAVRPGYKLELAQRTAAAMTYAGATVGVV